MVLYHNTTILYHKYSLSGKRHNTHNKRTKQYQNCGTNTKYLLQNITGMTSHSISNRQSHGVSPKDTSERDNIGKMPGNPTNTPFPIGSDTINSRSSDMKPSSSLPMGVREGGSRKLERTVTKQKLSRLQTSRNPPWQPREEVREI